MYGDKNVLSTTNNTLFPVLDWWSCKICFTLAISVTFKVGFDGVSNHTNLVSGFKEVAKSDSKSPTKVASTPW